MPGLLLAGLGLVVVLLLTLWPVPHEARRSQLTPIWCLVCGSIGMQDVLQNLLMLMPLGLGLGLLGWRVPRATLAGFALGLTVELLQYTVIAGRDASLSDVVTNTVGTALGALVAGRIDWLLRPPPRDAARLALGALGMWATLWVAAGWLLGAEPGPAPWHAEVRPHMLTAPPFLGDIVSAELTGTALRDGDQEVASRVIEAYGRDTVAFRASVIMGPPASDRRGLLEVRDGDSTTQLSVVERRGALHFAMRTRSSALLLRPLALRTPDVPADPAGTPLTLSVRRDAGTIVVAPRTTGASEVRAFIGPHWLATLLLPVEAWTGPGWEVFAHLWVVALLLPAGWWVAQSAAASRLVLAFAAFAVVIGGVRIVPPLFALSHSSAVGWVMTCGALALGLLLGRRLAPSDEP
ncbi:MAG TPA: VanZ family protein [Gemmatimonadales bacterium]|nr:VanZ family protein [Gemmatimonadales bacterium]